MICECLRIVECSFCTYCWSIIVRARALTSELSASHYLSTTDRELDAILWNGRVECEVIVHHSIYM